MEDTPALISCPDCQRHFPSLPELARHRELLHHSHPSRNVDEADGIPRPYRCVQCGRGYRHAGSLVNHRRTHEIGRFPCTTCNKDFSNPMALKSHLRTHAPEGRRRHRPPRHKEATSYSQGQMTATDIWGGYAGPGENWNNQASHGQSTHVWEARPDPREASSTWEKPPGHKDSWENRTDSKESAKGWGNTSGPTEAPVLPAPANSLLSNLEQYLAESMVDFTGNERPPQFPPAEDERRYKCGQCGKAYKHAGSLTNHRQSHALGVYPCAICFKEFSNLMALKNHSRLHAQYRPYQCPRCPRAFRLPSELLGHQQVHEGEGKGLPWEEKGEPSANGHGESGHNKDQLHGTKELNASGEFNTSGELDAGELNEGGVEEYRPFRCADCGRTYRHAGSLINHRKSHETGVYPCPVCPKQLFNAAALKNHLRAHLKTRRSGGGEEQHQPPPPIPLPSLKAPPPEVDPEEEENPSTPNTTTDHRPYKCSECGRAYRHRGSLVNHRHSHQTGEYQCSLCPRQYPNLMALRNHVRVHFKAARRNGSQGREELLSQDGEGITPGLEREDSTPSQEEDCPEEEKEQRTAQGKEDPSEEGPMDSRSEVDMAVAQICGLCGMLFEDVQSLKQHGQTHQEGEGSRAESAESPPRAYSCRDCGKTYRHSGSLINHRQTHQTGDFGCGTCAKHFHTVAAMKSHLRRHSRRRSKRHQRRSAGITDGNSSGVVVTDGNESSPEDYQDKDLVVKEEEKEKIDFHKDMKVNGVNMANGKLESSENYFQGDVERDKCKLERNEACFQSNEEGKTNEGGLEGKESCFLGNLVTTGNKRGSGDTPVVVEGEHKQESVCDAISHGPEALNGWRTSGHHTCHDCGRSFHHTAGLLNHRPCHPPGIYQCSLCPKEFDSLPALRSHFQNHGPGEATSEQPFLCCLCGMIFPGRADYRQHRSQVHDSPGESQGSSEDEEEETLTSNSPPLQLSEAELLNQLQREVEELDGAGYGHICACCGQTYDDLGSLERHHQSLGNISVDGMNVTPSDMGEKNEISETIVGDISESTVDSLCQDDTGTISGECLDTVSRDSMEAVGSVDTTSVLEIEGTSVEAVPEALSPAQPRPFQCSQCGKTYRHGGSLVNHRKIHQTGDFACPICARRYPNLAAYRNHLRNHPRCKGAEPQLGVIPMVESKETKKVAEVGPLQMTSEEVQKELKEKAVEEIPIKKEPEEATVKEEEVLLKDSGIEEGNSEKEASMDRPFSCELCGRTYKHAGSLINHRQSHQTGHFGCQACSKGFSNLMALKNHRRIHAEPRRFHCGECGKAFRLRKQLANHQRVHGEPRNGNSGGARKLLPKSPSLPRDERPFRCGQCGRTYRHAGSLLNHRRSHEIGQYSCPTCPKTYSNRMALKNHQRLHSESRRRRTGRARRGGGPRIAVRCALCSRSFPRRASLERHLREHEEASKRELDVIKVLSHTTVRDESQADIGELEGGSCEYELGARVNTQAKGTEELGPGPSGLSGGQEGNGEPLSWITGKTDGWHINETPVNKLGSQKHTSSSDYGFGSLCSQEDSQPSEPELSSLEGWDSRQIQDQDSGSQSQLELRPFCCGQCGKTYRHAGSLLNHRNTHKTGRYHCQLCSKEFSNPMAAKNHSRIHTATRRFKCPHCGKAFRASRELTIHQRAHALGQGQAPPQMEEADGQEVETKRDMEDKHVSGQGETHRATKEMSGSETAVKEEKEGLKQATELDRPFCCTQCGRSYRHAGSLLNHQKAHATGLYPCSLCPKLLPNLLALKNHGRTHTDPKRHRCGVCGKAFRTAARLEGHRRVHAPREGPFSCSHCPRRFRRQISFLQHQQQHKEEWTMTGTGDTQSPTAGGGDLSSPLHPPP
ncbi:LOW QUALITY PROTEIN: zinc finger protein 646 [Vombatus ursinus]|uniref:LOW QUALITY PROTEIN: zinc finger protein 646 n=1 Tax=Vombatus ursinus TaxID=29139 RepID=UPI000FFD1E7E|nr:LOW QUALITY PROTEIN: zinc finger protein 646 [Vombatus ursinus]